MIHITEILHGLAATAAVAAFFYVAGLVLTPRRWQPVLGGASPAVIGAAFYVIACWVAVSAWQVPLTGVMAGLIILVAVLAALRFRDMRAAVLLRVADRRCIEGAVIFALFYVLAYLLAQPPPIDRFLPPAWTSQIDLLTHARYARHLLMFGSPDLEAATFDLRHSPAIPELLAALSMFYREDPLRAAWPLQFSAVALIGLSASAVCRSLFRLSMPVSLTIAAIVVTSPVLQHSARTYRLEMLIAVAILLYLVWATARARSDSAVAALIATFAGAYALLLLTEPAALLPALAMQGIVVASRRDAWGAAPRIVGAAIVAMLALALAFHDHLRWYSAHRALADGVVPAAVACATVAMGLIAYMMFDTTKVLRLIPAPTDRRLAVALTLYAAIALMVANVALHASTRQRGPVRIPAAWSNVEQLRQRPFRELSVKLSRDPGGFLAAMTRYYLPATRLQVIAPGARLAEFDTVSKHSPLLIQHFGCEGVGHSDTMAVPDVGCALFAPPSVTLDTAYPFNRTFLAVEFDNMSDRETGGRWSTDRTLRVRLLADPERTPVDRTLHVNLLLNPFLQEGSTAQQLALTWGAQKHGRVAVGEAGWISVPVESGDWTGNRLWTLPVAVDFPDRKTILFDALSLSVTPRGALVK